MTELFTCPSAVRRCRAPAGRAGFTLIEVLVVVAIIALLVAILLPSLAKVREQSRRTVCMTQLKEFATATQMYVVDSRDVLPGPIHGAMELETAGKTASNDYEEWHLPSFIRKYFTDKGREGKLTDRVASCPTAVRLARKQEFGNNDFRRPFTYAVNNWHADQSAQVAYGTDPPWYFGYPNDFWQNTRPPFRRLRWPTSLTRDAAPKQIALVRNPAREWAFGDAFKWNPLPQLKPGQSPGQWQRGTYQFNFVHEDGLELIPRKPYHSDGINVAMFDGHVEYQREWRGTANPQK